MQRPSPVAPPVTDGDFAAETGSDRLELRLLHERGRGFTTLGFPHGTPTEAFEGSGHRRGKVRVGMREGKDFGWMMTCES